MNYVLFLILFTLIGCNSEESKLSSLSGMRQAPGASAPSIVSVTAPANGIYKNGNSFWFDFVFSKAVRVEGSPRLRFSTEDGVYYAYYVTGTDTNTLRFFYTVAAGVSDYNGISSLVLELNGGSIYDPIEDEDSWLTFASPPLWGILLDGVTPTIDSITRPADGDYSTGQTLQFTLHFSHRVCGYGNPRLQVNIGGTIRYAERVAEPCSSSMKFNYTIAASDQDDDGVQLAAGGVDLTLPSSAIRDSFGDNAILTFTSVVYNTVTVNYVGPPANQISTTPPAPGWFKKADVLTFAMNFDQNITINGGSPHLTINIGGVNKTASWDSTTNGTSSVVFKYTVAATDMDSDGIVIGNISYNSARFIDSNGVTVTPVNSWNPGIIRVDGIAPTISSMTIPGNGIVFSGSSLDFVVNWSESVVFSGPTPYLSINVDSNATPKQAASQSHTGVSTTYQYLIQSSDADFNGISLPSASLTLPAGGTVKDVAGNSAVLSFTPQSTSGIRIVPSEVDHWYDPSNSMSFGSSSGTQLNELRDLIGGNHFSISSSPKWNGSPKRIDFDHPGQQMMIANMDDFEKIYIVMGTKGSTPGYLFFEDFDPDVSLDFSGGFMTTPGSCGTCVKSFNGTIWNTPTPFTNRIGTYALNTKHIIMLDYTDSNLDDVDLYFGGGYIGYIDEIFILRGNAATNNAGEFLRALQQKHPGATLP